MYFINEELFLCMREITPGPALAEHTCDTAVSSVLLSGTATVASGYGNIKHLWGRVWEGESIQGGAAAA
jgi:hypothetical protein